MGPAWAANKSVTYKATQTLSQNILFLEGTAPSVQMNPSERFS